jgi:hypothetical protein
VTVDEILAELAAGNFDALVGVAEDERLAGRADAAAQLLGATAAARLTNDYVAPPLELESTKQTERRVRKQLPTQTFERAYRQGAQLTLQEAAKEAHVLGISLLAEQPVHP